MVTELFYSIQGESTQAGRPFAFVRLSGCNLRCAWCDTPYAWSEGTAWPMDAVMARIRELGCRRVAITGGEPLLQSQTPALIRRLIDDGFRVVVETNGSLDISLADPRSTRVMDIKCPSSGHAECTDWDNLARLTANDEIKFVVANASDFEYAEKQLAYLAPLPVTPDRILFSPVLGRLAPQRLAQWILENQLNVRLQLQLHKQLWDPSLRGV